MKSIIGGEYKLSQDLLKISNDKSSQRYQAKDITHLEEQLCLRLWMLYVNRWEWRCRSFAFRIISVSRLSKR